MARRETPTLAWLIAPLSSAACRFTRYAWTRAMPPKPPDPGPLLARLNERQRAFVEAYWTTGHATNAATAAGYARPSRQGSRLCSYPAVRAVPKVSGDRLRREHYHAMRRRVAESARKP